MPISLSQARGKYYLSNKTIIEKFKTLFRRSAKRRSWHVQRTLLELTNHEAAAEVLLLSILYALETSDMVDPRPITNRYYGHETDSSDTDDELWENDTRLQPPTYDDRDQLPPYSAEPVPPQYVNCQAVLRRQLRRHEGVENLAQTWIN